MLAITVKTFNSQRIRIRESDRYVSLTDMAQATGKNVADFLRLEKTKSYLDTLSTIMGIPVMAQNQGFQALVEIKRGGSNLEETGTWGHPKVSLRFAQWCSDDFAVQVDFWIDELITTGSVSLKPMTELEKLHRLTGIAVELERSQKLLESRQSSLEQKFETIESHVSPHGWYSIKAYARIHGIKVNRATANKMGRDATALCKIQGIEKGEVRDESWGIVGSYPEDILESVFEVMLVK